MTTDHTLPDTLPETLDPTWPNFMKALYYERKTFRALFGANPHLESLAHKQFLEEKAAFLEEAADTQTH